MAKRRQRYPITGHRPVNIDSMEQSRFWLRLHDLTAVRIELNAQRRQLPAAAPPRYDMHMPSKVRRDISAASKSQIRNLKSKMRSLRLKMNQKGDAREPVDGELIRPGWVREPDSREEELRVTLDWGTDAANGW